MTIADQTPAVPVAPIFLNGGGAMGAAMRSKDWSQTLMGEPGQWPASLKTALSIVLTSRFPMVIFWGKEHICFYNDGFAPSLDADKHPWALGRPSQEIWPEAWKTVLPLINQVIENQDGIWQEDMLVPLMRKGHMQNTYWVFSYSPLINEQGQVCGVLSVCMETTTKVEAHQQLLENKDQLEFAINAAQLGTWDLNPRTNKFTSNQRLKEIFGLNAGEEADLEEAINNVVDEDQDILRNAINKALQYDSGGLFDCIYRVRNPRSGQETFARAVGQVSFDQFLEPVRFNGIIRDVTTDILMQKEVSHRAAKFRSIIKEAPVGITILSGSDFVVEVANDAYLEIVDRKAEDFVGKSLFAGLPEVRSAVEPLLKRVMETGESYHGHEFPVTINRYNRSDLTYFNFVYQAMRNAAGDIDAVVVVANEVTDLVKAKHKLQESESRFRSMMMDSPFGITILRGERFVIEMANKVMAEKLWRKKLEDLEGLSLLDVFPELQGQEFPELLQHVYETGVKYTDKEAIAWVQGDDGLRKFYLDYEYQPLFNDEGKVTGVLATVNDVTDKVEARQQVEAGEARTRMIVDASQLGTYEINLQTGEWVTNDTLPQIYGLPPGVDREAMIRTIHPDDLHHRDLAYQEAMQSGVLEYESRIVWPEDKSLHWIRVTGKILKDQQGNPWRLLGIAQDITEQKSFAEELKRLVNIRTQELQLKNQELERSNANLEDFAYAASHDMKEPIRKIRFFADRVKDAVIDKLDIEQLRYFDRLEVAAKRMGLLIDDLLTYSQVNSEENLQNEVDLNETVRQVLHDLDLEVEDKGAVIHVDQLPVILGHPRQLQQALQNLLSNALKFSKAGVTPEISIRSQRFTAEDLEIPGIEAGVYYALSIKDNGIGFEQQDAERIFDVFTRLHGQAEYRGTGLGLSIVRKVIDNHKGFIRVQSAPGQGALFQLFFPVSPTTGDLQQAD